MEESISNVLFSHTFQIAEPTELSSPYNKESYPALTKQILESWQREYDRRPYNKLIITKSGFYEKFNRDFDELDFEVVLNFLESCENINHIELLYINIPSRLSISQIKTFISCIKRMEYVALINVNFTKQFAIALGAEEIASSPDSSKFTIQRVPSVVELLKLSLPSKIRILRIRKNRLTWKRSSILNSFIIKNECLQYLDLSECQIVPSSFTLIINGILNSNSLLGIDLSSILVRQGISAVESCRDTMKMPLIIAQLILSNNLSEIHLRRCNLKSSDMERVCKFIPESNLKIIDFSGNKIGPDGCRLLLKSIIKCKYLESLDLSYNPLQTLGGEVIVRLLPCTSLINLSIAFCSLGVEALDLIIFTLENPCILKTLYIFGNHFSQKSLQIIYKKIVAKTIVISNLDINIQFNLTTGKYSILRKLIYDSYFSDFL